MTSPDVSLQDENGPLYRTWKEVVEAVLMMLSKAYGFRRVAFSARFHIVPMVDAMWDELWENKRKPNWPASATMTLSKYPKLFIQPSLADREAHLWAVLPAYHLHVCKFGRYLPQQIVPCKPMLRRRSSRRIRPSLCSSLPGSLLVGSTDSVVEGVGSTDSVVEGKECPEVAAEYIPRSPSVGQQREEKQPKIGCSHDSLSCSSESSPPASSPENNTTCKLDKTENIIAVKECDGRRSTEEQSFPDDVKEEQHRSDLEALAIVCESLWIAKTVVV